MNDNETEKVELPKFHLTELFPNSTSIFSTSLLPLDDVKEHVLIVLDTNSLIIPYTVHKKSLDEIKAVYQKLIEGKRLFIPAQVAREFATLRGDKIRELFQKTSLKQNIASINIEKYPLLDSLDGYSELLNVEKEINEKIADYRKAIKPILSVIRSWKWNDPVSVIYKDLFNAEIIVEASLSQEGLQKDFDRRSKNRIPPGYKDGGKDDGGIGDVIIWNTILELGQKKKKPLIFVTGEEKADWMLRSNSEALYPRFELIDEYSRVSDGNSFYILKFSELLDLFGVEEKVVAEVKKEEVIQLLEKVVINDANRTRNDLVHLGHTAEKAIFNWLIKTYPTASIDENRQFPDYIVRYPTDVKIGVEVRAFRSINPTLWLSKVRELSYRAYYEIQEGGLTSVVCALVFEDETYAIEAAELYRRRSSQISNLEIVIGYLQNNEFFPVHNEFPSIW